MSFALQALCVRRLAEQGKTLPIAVHPVPDDINREVALRKLSALGAATDTLTPDQERYLFG